MSDKLPRLFISYATEDHSFVAPIYERLQEAGFGVFIDRHDLPLGTDFERSLESAISETDTLLVMATRRSLASSWVNTEVGMARMQAKRIVPILFEDVELSNSPLSSYQGHPMFRGGAESWRALDALVTKIGGESIPRVYDATGREKVLEKVLVLGHARTVEIDPNVPNSIAAMAIHIGREATPILKRENGGAAFIVPGYAPLATACIAYLSGSCGGLPKIMWTHTLGSRNDWKVCRDWEYDLQSLRDEGRRSGYSGRPASPPQ